jgi:hypothetical protein
MPKLVFMIFLGPSFIGVFNNLYLFFIGTYIPFPDLFQAPVTPKANILIIMRTHMNTG